jgi:hypothetical protein
MTFMGSKIEIHKKPLQTILYTKQLALHQKYIRHIQPFLS